jgi:hypothetical protein
MFQNGGNNMAPKCPWCKETLLKLKVSEIKADGLNHRGMIAHSLACSMCDSVISVSLHPNIYKAMTTLKK